MERTITIKGVGRATIKPDFVVLSLTIEAKEKKYANIEVRFQFPTSSSSTNQVKFISRSSMYTKMQQILKN